MWPNNSRLMPESVPPLYGIPELAKQIYTPFQMSAAESDILPRGKGLRGSNRGCGSGPFSAGFRSSKSEFYKPEPDPWGTRQESIQFFTFFSHQSDFFRYLNLDFFLPEKMEKVS